MHDNYDALGKQLHEKKCGLLKSLHNTWSAYLEEERNPSVIMTCCTYEGQYEILQLQSECHLKTNDDKQQT